MEWVADSPFRAIEGAIAVPFLLLGLHMLSPWYTPGRGSPLWDLVEPFVIIKITGVMYVISGIALMHGACLGRVKPRRIAMRIFLFTMLYALLLRVTEEGFGLNTIGYLIALVVLASVDIIQMSGEDVSRS